jgi:hypothetical protein
MKYCFAILTIMAGVLPAHAISVSGEANTPCREFTVAATPRQVQLIFWVNGFVSARNVYSLRQDTAALSDRAVAVELWEYCKKSPEAWLINASIYIAAKIAHETAPVYMSPEPPRR